MKTEFTVRHIRLQWEDNEPGKFYIALQFFLDLPIRNPHVTLEQSGSLVLCLRMRFDANSSASLEEMHLMYDGHEMSTLYYEGCVAITAQDHVWFLSDAHATRWPRQI